METTAEPARAGRKGKGYFLPGLIALAALVGLGLFVGAGDLDHGAPSRLDGTALASQIALAIQAERNSVAAPHVTCPASEPVRLNFRFDCTLSGGRPTVVHVTEVDRRGQVRWSLAP
jgi:hypothetical protein